MLMFSLGHDDLECVCIFSECSKRWLKGRRQRDGNTSLRNLHLYTKPWGSRRGICFYFHNWFLICHLACSGRDRLCCMISVLMLISLSSVCVARRTYHGHWCTSLCVTGCRPSGRTCVCREWGTAWLYKSTKQLLDSTYMLIIGTSVFTSVVFF